MSHFRRAISITATDLNLQQRNMGEKKKFSKSQGARFHSHPIFVTVHRIHIEFRSPIRCYGLLLAKGRPSQGR